MPKVPAQHACSGQSSTWTPRLRAEGPNDRFDHNGSDDGGGDEFVEFCPSRACNSVIRASNFAIGVHNRAMISFASSSVFVTGGGLVIVEGSSGGSANR